MAAMVKKEIYSPFEIYTSYDERINSERDIFILAGAMLKVMCILHQNMLAN